jgi:hypothetical protein
LLLRDIDPGIGWLRSGLYELRTELLRGILERLKMQDGPAC